jgi:hypothetical protein
VFVEFDEMEVVESDHEEHLVLFAVDGLEPIVLGPQDQFLLEFLLTVDEIFVEPYEIDL